MNAGYSIRHLLIRQTTPLTGRIIVLLDPAQSPAQVFLRGFDHRHMHPGIGKGHRNATAHGSGPKNRDLLDSTPGGICWNIRNFGGLALCEERVHQRT